MSGSGLASPLLWHLDQLVVGLAAKNAEETASQISSVSNIRFDISFLEGWTARPFLQS